MFFKSIATLNENKNEFDYIFLEHEKYYEENIIQSIKILRTIGVLQFMQGKRKNCILSS